MAPATVRRYRQYGNTEVMEVGTRRCSPFLSFHLQTRKNERAHRLRIIAAHRLVHVVIKRAGAIALPFFGIASQTGNRAGLIDADDTTCGFFRLAVRMCGASDGTAARTSLAISAPMIALPSALRCVWSIVPSVFIGPIDASPYSCAFTLRSMSVTFFSLATSRVAAAYFERTGSS